MKIALLTLALVVAVAFGATLPLGDKASNACETSPDAC